MAGEWYNVGDGIDLDIALDLNQSGGYNETTGSVTQVNNLGTESLADFTPDGTQASVVTTLSFTGMAFDGGTVQPYSGAGTYASTFDDVTNTLAAYVAFVPNVVNADQCPWQLGEDLGGRGLYPYYDSNGLTIKWRKYNIGGSNLTIPDVTDKLTQTADIMVTMGLHHASENVTAWHNGALLSLKQNIPLWDSQSIGTSDTIQLGATNNDVFDLNADLMAMGLDNKSSVTLDHAFAKYKGLFNYYMPAGSRRAVTSVLAVGQSNAEGDFTNTETTITFSSGDDLYSDDYNSVVDDGEVYVRTGWGHSSIRIGASSPAIYFCDEWKSLTGENIIFQESCESGDGLCAGASGDTEYWEPKNAVGDAALATSHMEKHKESFERYRDLIDYSYEVNEQRRILFVVQGEADAVSINGSDPAVTEAKFVIAANAWLDDFRDLYGFTHFAVVNIGRRGTTQIDVDNNTPGVEDVRSAWQTVAASRADTYLVYEHLNNTTFVLDDLVVDSDGYWVSGQANNADGIHYTTAQYEAIGRTAARNLYDAIQSESDRLTFGTAFDVTRNITRNVTESWSNR